MTCSHCRKPLAHRSHAQGVQDRIYRCFQIIPYRCRGCKTRFYVWRSGEKTAGLRTGEERKIMQLRRRMKWKRNKKELALYSLGGAAMLAFLYLIIQQRVG